MAKLPQEKRAVALEKKGKLPRELMMRIQRERRLLVRKHITLILKRRKHIPGSPMMRIPRKNRLLVRKPIALFLKRRKHTRNDFIPTMRRLYLRIHVQGML